MINSEIFFTILFYAIIAYMVFRIIFYAIQEWPDFIWRRSNVAERKRIDKLREVLSSLKEGDRVCVYFMHNRAPLVAKFYYVYTSYLYYSINSEVKGIPVSDIRKVVKL